VVVEDVPAGIEAARAGGMASIGVARLNDAALLRAAHGNLVVTSLDQVCMDALVAGRLEGRPSQ
jgi:beta-phosphoglucomutase-like phosphatase (HAD superfamily)